MAKNVFILVLAITLAVPTVSACAQEPNLSEKFDKVLVVGGPLGEVGVSILALENGDYVVAGYEYDDWGFERWDALLLRVSSTGDVVWRQRWNFGTSGEDYAWAVRPVADNGFVIAGTATSSDGDTNGFFRKVNSKGDVQWTRFYGGSGEESLWAVETLSDGGFVLVGESSSDSAGDNDLNIFLVRTDSDGRVMWSQTYGGPGTDRAHNVAALDDGGFLLVGFSGQEHETMNIQLVRTDSDGVLQWSKTFGGNGFDVGHDIIKHPDYGFVVAGYSSTLGSDDQDVFIMHIDEDGRILWLNTQGDENDNRALHIAKSAAGDLILVGYSSSQGEENWDLDIFAFDKEGAPKWRKRWSGPNNDIGKDIIAVPSGGLVIVGATQSTTPPYDDIVILRCGGVTKDCF